VLANDAALAVRRPADGGHRDDVGRHYAQTAEELFWQGAAAAVITDILEEAGYRVEVYANRVSERHGRRHCIRVKVKEADMPMRLDGVVAVLCHAGIFRTFGFLCSEGSRNG
jgi:hypothetical protein